MRFTNSAQLSNKAYEVIIVGLGAVGAAALYQLSKRGVSVLGIDQFDPPHNLGSSHGETRITRLAVGEGKDYVALAMRSHQIWKEIESLSCKKLYFQTGGILMDSGISPWEKHGTKSFLDRTISFAEEFGIAHKVINAEDTITRFPQICLESNGKTYAEEATGYLLPELCIATQLELALSLGADVLVNTKVLRLENIENGTKLILEGTSLLAKKVVLTAGGWIKDFLPKEESRKFKICRQVLHWLEIESLHDLWKNSPVYMWGIGPKPEDFIYGFPSLDGRSVKMATESFLETDHPDLINREVAEQEKAEFWKNKVSGRVQGLSGRILKSSVCFYTVTEDGRFVIRPLQNHSAVLMVSACSGHGFKHSAALGEFLAQEVCAEVKTVELEID
ncbi:MAG: sarcosine oxidase [Algoriphagus sp.]|jgi:sarcosine oxidase